MNRQTDDLSVPYSICVLFKEKITDQCEDGSTKKVPKISSVIMCVYQLTETERGGGGTGVSVYV
jgi:hypothetical protein